jgi:hypothetical protein
MEQVNEYNASDPAKLTDIVPYRKKFGNESWEVDALPPDVLSRLIRDCFDDLIDVEKMNSIKHRENNDREKLRKAVKALRT